MKKGMFLSSTSIWAYWVELPLIALLVWAISFNGTFDNFMKLYPLIIALSLAIIFAAIYLFRLVKISYSEIRTVGWFSSRDSAIINEARRIKMKFIGGGKIKLSLIGVDELAGFDWLKPEDESVRKEITLFRTLAYGGNAAARRVMRYFLIPEEDFCDILSGAPFARDYGAISIRTYNPEDGFEVDLIINTTINSEYDIVSAMP